jgi:glycerol-3-phosphate acyltransferase PlsY
MGRDALAMILAYLIGSVPFAFLVAKARVGVDIRQVGEGNAGARNVYHTVGPVWGVLVGVLDLGKGWLAYQVARWMGVSETALLLSGFAVILGHNFPFLRWKQGGKGAAALLGFLLGLLPFPAVTAILIAAAAHLFLRDANRSLVVVCVALVLAPLAYGQPLWTSVYIAGLMLTMALKKVLDRGHEQRVWAESAWTDGAVPGFHGQGAKQ